MAYIDKNGHLRNSKEDWERWNAYCRSRVPLMKNTAAFIERIDIEYENWVFKGRKPAPQAGDERRG